MPVYRPAMACNLTVPTFGTSANRVAFTIPIRPRRASLEYNDHNHADTLTVACAWKDLPLDPRLLKSASVQFHLGDSNLGEVHGRRFARFNGIMDVPTRVAKEGGGFEVELAFRDYTALFLGQKLGSDAIPNYSQTLLTAWQQICDHVGPVDDDGKVVESTVKILRDKLVCRGGVSPELPLPPRSLHASRGRADRSRSRRTPTHGACGSRWSG